MKKTDYDNLTAPTRQRTSVAIQGLDTSTPDDIVADGKCEKLHNLRFKDGAWRPINNFALRATYDKHIELGTDENGLQVYVDVQDIIIPFSPVGKNAYICYTHKNTVSGSLTFHENGYSVIDFDNAKYILIDEPIPLNNEQIHCFGNVVYIGDRSFIYTEGAFKPFDIKDFNTYNTVTFEESIPIEPTYFKVNKTFPSKYYDGQVIAERYHTIKQFASGDDLLQAILDEDSLPAYLQITLAWKMANRDDNGKAEDSTIPDTIDNKISGEHAFFTAFRMTDGTIINPSALSIAITQNSWKQTVVGDEINIRTSKPAGSADIVIEENQQNVVLAQIPTTATEYSGKSYAPLGTYANENITIQLPDDTLPTFIKSVAVYSTRLYPSLKRDLSAVTSESLPIGAFFNDVKLPEEPFYLLKEIPLTDFKDNTYTLSLNYTSFSQIVNNPVYSPNIVNKLSSAGSFDYNQRLHMFDTTQEIPNAQFLKAGIGGINKFSYQTGISLSSNGKEYVKWGPSVSGSQLGYPFQHILSFHDARVTDFFANLRGSTKSYRYQASQALGNNIAYYIRPSTNAVRYPGVTFDNNNTSSLTPAVSNDTIYEPNRLQVSSPNNPLALPFDLSYRFGSVNNRILALQVATMQVAEEKVGDLPLYVFTEEGIYALRAGSETVYAKTEFINFDKIVNPNTIAVDGGIIYITYRGVHLLRGSNSTVISTPIHGIDGAIPPLLYDCKMLTPAQSNEVVFFKEDSYEAACVYNLDTGYWSTRDLYASKLTDDMLVTSNGDSFNLYDTDREPESSLRFVNIETRAIKLGNVEFKRLETIIPRMTANANVVLDAAQALDMGGEQWKVLHSGAYKPPYSVMRRTPYSARYFRVKINGTGTSTFSITNIDFEWYERFRRKMR